MKYICIGPPLEYECAECINCNILWVPRHDISNGNDSVRNNLLLPWRGYTTLGMEDVELCNDSRERRPYISKLLDETYNGICLYETFPGERRRAYLVLCRMPPDVRSGHANRDVGIQNGKRGMRSLTPSTTHFRFNSPPCVHQHCSLTQQCDLPSA